ARAHLLRVIDLAPDHAVARERLGFVRRGGEWVGRNELAHERDDEAARMAAIAKWQTKIQEIRTALEHRSPQRRERAIEKFQKILSPQAIPAIEAVFPDGRDDLAIPAIDVLAALSAPHASPAPAP